MSLCFVSWCNHPTIGSFRQQEMNEWLSVRFILVAHILLKAEGLCPSLHPDSDAQK